MAWHDMVLSLPHGQDRAGHGCATDERGEVSANGQALVMWAATHYCTIVIFA